MRDVTDDHCPTGKGVMETVGELEMVGVMDEVTDNVGVTEDVTEIVTVMEEETEMVVVTEGVTDAVPVREAGRDNDTVFVPVADVVAVNVLDQLCDAAADLPVLVDVTEGETERETLTLTVPVMEDDPDAVPV